MSANKYQPHVLVLPEDDANRQIANGFQLKTSKVRQMQVLEVAGGWKQVLASFASNHVPEMRRSPHRLLVLLIDFDGNLGRLETAKANIPGDLTDRVFLLGVLSEPEALRGSLALSYEDIGSALARDCRDNTDETWGHHLLRHNEGELQRLRDRVLPILFP